MIERCFEEAKKVLKENAVKNGIVAGREFYQDIWGRDALVSCLGMSASEDPELIALSEKTIVFLSKYQKHTGQMPNKVSPDGKRICFGEGGCVDTSLWFPIAVMNHYRNTRDKTFLKQMAPKVEKAMDWAECLDQNNDSLLETHEGADWMDMLLRSGRVLYDQVLYYKALTAADEILGLLGKKRKFTEMAQIVRENINLLMWPKANNREKVQKLYGYTGIEKDFDTIMAHGELDHYYADVGFRKFDPRCDVFANVLALLFDVADQEKAEKIISHLQSNKVAEPFPIKVLDPPIDKDHFRPFYFRYTDLPKLQEPGSYHNGGIWPFAGGFYVMMLKRYGLDWKAALEQLAEVNRIGKENEWEFNEWLTASGTPGGSAYQSWSAAMYILAYQYVKGKAKLWWLSPFN